MNKTRINRNLIIFTIATLGAGWLGLALNQAMGIQDAQQSLGILLWLVIPLLTALLLRAFGGDGWQDFGLTPHLRSGWAWYLVAALIFPLASFLTLGFGTMIGIISLSGFASQGLAAFLTLTGIAFASSLVKNIFEEFAWRGYLTPRFEALKLNPFVNHLLTGLIWSAWHIPYWLFFVSQAQWPEFTSLDRPTFILLGVLINTASAITYGELRLLSKTVWPAVILHSMANAVTLTLLVNGFVQLSSDREALFSPGNAGIITASLLTLAGIGLHHYRMKKSPARILPAPGLSSQPQA